MRERSRPGVTAPGGIAPRVRHRSGFSLVEVVLAIGIVAFCLIAVFGLLPTGLKSVKEANNEAGAANVMNLIADGLRNAVTTNGGTNFSFSYGGQTVTYAVGGSRATVTWNNLALEGSINSPIPRFSACLSLTPPVNLVTPGSALITVAWPPTATWVPASTNWTGAAGSITTGILFIPRQ